ncbi:hypothetical protein COO60DRAFT_391267 [Scenedesmus sp. NREL 46B-D3]|nr:hypothetical protein COO60DRAFT_391267 [Scenedesmus sp. NREL 46B-D3]
MLGQSYATCKAQRIPHLLLLPLFNQIVAMAAMGDGDAPQAKNSSHGTKGTPAARLGTVWSRQVKATQPMVPAQPAACAMCLRHAEYAVDPSLLQIQQLLEPLQFPVRL